MKKSKRVLTALALMGTAFAATASSAGSAHALAGIGEGPGGLLAAPGFLLADTVTGGELPVGQGEIGSLADKAVKEKMKESQGH
ncbi:hypothetical protein BX285_0747 [Streptomyces sp. 1114.5]|uniref:hypothetical protein n=1 Tax=unclassified Streptomyces TaxID=2593676 RepID=UPI000BC775DD|nr:MULTISPECIES: hypothetical protein [unclassified Streptomyces]RKT16412.1 hypothetical protein BX285_0747 [Streptomyces sp. 1114.5]SOB82582.1 hypothetical protein SAMN06272789_2752 [Streptomyces sp. 1331.2]